MNKQTKNPSLFKQALEIAIKEGKAQSSKDADTFNSGIVGENYLLYSKERKLLISIPLEKLKRNTRKKNNIGKVSNTNKVQGCLVNSLVVTAILAVLSAISLPKFEGLPEKARSAAAANTIATIAKECAVKKAVKEIDPKFSIFELENYTITPLDLNCDGDEK